MKKIYYLFTLIIPAFLLLTAYHTGSPGGKTGSPGDNGAMCNDCHTGTPIHEENWITTDIPIDGYVPGQTYTVTATATDETAALFGFEITAEDSEGNKVGNFILVDDVETQFTNNMNAVTHTDQGITPSGNSKTWTVEWAAPEEGFGALTFYAAFNAANGNGNNSGDIIHFSEDEYGQSTTSVADQQASLVKLYPNPANEYLIFEHSENEVIFELVNLNGKIVRQGKTRDKSMELDISQIPSGVYIFRVNGEKSNHSTKLLVR